MELRCFLLLVNDYIYDAYYFRGLYAEDDSFHCFRNYCHNLPYYLLEMDVLGWHRSNNQFHTRMDSRLVSFGIISRPIATYFLSTVDI